MYCWCWSRLSCTAVLRADVTGSVQGTVHDRSGGAVSGAKVLITNVATNDTKEVASAADGSFRLLALAAGTYKLSVTASGFRPFEEAGIVISVNDQLSFDVTLDVGSVSDKVEVAANAVQVQTESTQLGDVIDSKKMLALPLNGRSFIDLLGLQAGVAPGSAETIQQDRPVSGILNSGNISVNGQRETANAYLVNGGDVSEGRNLGAGLVPNLDSIEEFRLITNSFDAEYGKFSGAVVNAITKSGTNGFHGDAFEFLRNDKMDATNYFAPSKSELRRNQFGYAAGGPAIKNKTVLVLRLPGHATGTRRRNRPRHCPDRRPTRRQFRPDRPDRHTSDGAYWANVLATRLGYPVTQGEAYSSADCATTAQCVFPGGVIPQSAWSTPAKNILSFIPTATLPGDTQNYSDNSQRNIANDNKFGERIDFNNQKTGNWSFYYHLDNTTVTSGLAGLLQRTGLPDHHAFARSRVCDEQHQADRRDLGE